MGSTTSEIAFVVTVDGEERLLFKIKSKEKGDVYIFRKHPIFRLENGKKKKIVTEKISIHPSFLSDPRGSTVTYESKFENNFEEKNFQFRKRMHSLFASYVFGVISPNLKNCRYNYINKKNERIINILPSDIDNKTLIYHVLATSHALPQDFFLNFPFNVIGVCYREFYIYVLAALNEVPPEELEFFCSIYTSKTDSTQNDIEPMEIDDIEHAINQATDTLTSERQNSIRAKLQSIGCPQGDVENVVNDIGSYARILVW